MMAAANMCVSYEIGADLLGEHETVRGLQVAARLAWRRCPSHAQEVTLVAVRELLVRGAAAAALDLVEEALREHDRAATP